METQKIYLVVCFFLGGVFLKRLPLKKNIKSRLPIFLNKSILYVCLPALILKIMPSLELKKGLWPIPVSHWLVLFCLSGLLILTSKIFKLDRQTTGCLLILIPLGNTSFLGYPMVEAFFKDSGLPYAILYDQLGSFLGLALYAPFIVAIYSGEERPSIMIFLKSIGRFPPLIALLLSFFLKDIFLMKNVQMILLPLSKGIVPLAMMTVGLQFQAPCKGQGLPLSLGLFFKMVLSPVLTSLLFFNIGNVNFAEKVIIFQSAMPPMISAAILAAEKDLKKDLAMNLMGFGLLFAFLTLPLCFYLLKA